MTSVSKKLKIGIVGCGAIGSRIALSIKRELKQECTVSAIFDIVRPKAAHLGEKIGKNKIVKTSLSELIKNCDLVVEAVNAPSTRDIIFKSIKAKRHVLAMSVGKLLKAKDLCNFAERQKVHLLLPSGAIAGIDAVKAASLAKIHEILLTTRKPPSGFTNNRHIQEKGIDLSKITEETVLFDGDVDTAVKLFPQNINVAATLALASKVPGKIRIRIITSPKFTINSHEIDVTGDFGRITSKTENVVCPDNPKTSYLAVLSGIQTLKQFCHSINIGT
ncbi:MAG: hypothetical protein A2Z88_08615 [Omnitrophica WOR_2 bacterium GWA2_47_8]|nr:MAG: hypothetical protein A2Z88_08615 [Omnitrophica WOR_2 bacterium GWA2_47_8]